MTVLSWSFKSFIFFLSCKSVGLTAAHVPEKRNYLFIYLFLLPTPWECEFSRRPVCRVHFKWSAPLIQRRRIEVFCETTSRLSITPWLSPLPHKLFYPYTSIDSGSFIYIILFRSSAWRFKLFFQLAVICTLIKYLEWEPAESTLLLQRGATEPQFSKCQNRSQKPSLK